MDSVGKDSQEILDSGHCLSKDRIPDRSKLFRCKRLSEILIESLNKLVFGNLSTFKRIIKGPFVHRLDRVLYIGMRNRAQGHDFRKIQFDQNLS